MNVLIPTEKFWPDYAGWINQVILIAKNNPDMVITSINRKGRLRNSTQIKPDNIELIKIKPELSSQSIFHTIKYLVKVLLHILKYKREYDIIFLPYSFFPGFIFIAFGNIFNIPVIARISGNELNGESIPARLRYFFLKKANAVVALNQDSVIKLKEKGIPDDRIYFIPNGVVISPNKVKKSNINYPFCKDRIIILFVGLICRRKGVNELITSFLNILERGFNSTLLLVGPTTGTQEHDDLYLNMIQEKIKLNEYILLLGEKSESELNDLYRSADIFTLPSYSEGMPNVLLESMSFGLPIVGSDIPGINDVISNNNDGLLFNVGDSSSLTKSLIKLLEDKDLRKKLGSNARKKINNSYSDKKIAMQYKKLFLQIAKN